MVVEHVDVLIVGAGLSGIGAAWHLQTKCPDKSYAILEGRDTIGGTWDLFRYPGVRSDSDMHTLGYSFRPWTAAKAIADGSDILAYVKDTAKEGGITSKIRFKHMVRRASWSSEQARWTVEAQRSDTGDLVQIQCSFLFMCSGYYRYSSGHTPQFTGAERFQGQIVHPQQWPADLAYAGKRVVIIGSGATAVTLAPSMAQSAAHVTMLQRSPTYVVDRPSVDAIGKWLEARLPATLAYRLTRVKNVFRGWFYFRLSKRRPQVVKQKMIEGVQMALGADYDVAKHFTPNYKPWDQRVCLVPDGDLFKSIRSGKVSVVTDHIDSFTENGIKTQSGELVPADIIVTATGLELEILGGMQVVVDGKIVDFSRSMNYKGFMYSDVPNLAAAFGYTNASWTLKCDLTCEYVCRLLKTMDSVGMRQCTPRQKDPSISEQPLLDFTSGYVVRAMERSPKQGSKAPWRVYQNYFLDLLAMKFGKVDDGVVEFSNPAKAGA